MLFKKWTAKRLHFYFQAFSVIVSLYQPCGWKNPTIKGKKKQRHYNFLPPEQVVFLSWLLLTLRNAIFSLSQVSPLLPFKALKVTMLYTSYNAMHKLSPAHDDQSQWLFTTHPHSPFLLSKASEAINRLLGHILSPGPVILVKIHAVYSPML